MDTNAGRLRRPGSDAAIAHVPVEERYRTLVDAIQDYAIFLLDPTGHIASWNAGAERIKGYRADEVIGQHFSVFYPAEAIAQNYPSEELKRAAALGRWEDEGWRIRKDGSRFWANVVITALRDEDGDLIGFAKVTRDLTERERLKQLEYASELAARVEATREEEKKRIARELHDDLGQQLTALKMTITGLIADEGSTPEAQAYTRERTRSMSHAIDHALASVRRLAAGLRPTMLDDLGLLPALDWLVTDFGQHTGLRVALNCNTHTVAFNDTASTALFRIVQEGLTNVARHAASATEVVIDLRCDRSNCELTIHNDGAVVTRSAEPSGGRPPPSGIAGIRDRVRRLGGTFAAGPLPQGGYRIQLSVPRKAIELVEMDLPPRQ
ncbi:PAS domain-containing sensor histidine kinase [Ralstonia mojiangensis]|uniref:PAS domain-containing sensor histidine kinase n=1 Tax=Ralstonia mojiangensis TaxID=2953895 RepID=UPI0021B4929C|nr:PAS domain S-box protein [Ralstonia mojiangensis]MCT7325851.1 PAS domain S-box protein [Ralstonia mojiangensis]